jgi:phosphoadenosine phosphosulfate reductase
MSTDVTPLASASPLAGSAGATSSAIALYARPAPDYPAKLQATIALLQDAAAHGPVVQASSLGAEDMVLPDLLDRHDLPIGIFVLDTGTLHAETLALLDRLQTRQAAHPRAPLTVYRPDAQAVADFIAREGQEAMYRSIELRKACCAIRKLEPLSRALAGQRGWITGLRREQSDARADVPAIDHSEAATRGLTKYNPLADWTWGDVWHYIATQGVDYNPLHDRFYPSIGCAPCTRAITLGEDFRAGRWWWESESAKECGLHVKPGHEPQTKETP